MGAQNLPVGGMCRCSATRFEIRTAPVMTFACHCRDCQRMTASAFSLTAMVPAEGFRITKGTPVARPLPGSPRQHHFCPVCMTWMFTRIDGAPERVNVRPTLCEGGAWSTPFAEVMTRDRLPWAATPALHSYETMPPPADFVTLLAAFANWIGTE